MALNSVSGVNVKNLRLLSVYRMKICHSAAQNRKCQSRHFHSEPTLLLTKRGQFAEIQISTHPHISVNLKASGNDVTRSGHPQAEPTISLYGLLLSVSRSKDQRCACLTHSSPPVSRYSLQLGIPTFPPPSLFLLFPLPSCQTDSSIHPLHTELNADRYPPL